MPCMGNQQQNHVAGHAQSLPAQLAIFDTILARNMQWVIEYEPGCLESDPVLTPVALVFGVIP